MPIQVLVSQAGGLPIKATFNSVGDEPVYLEVNGSIWTELPNFMIGILIQIDGQSVGQAVIFSNTPETHRAVVPAYIQLQLGFGQHTIELLPLSFTLSDANDFYTAVIHY